MSAYEIVSVSVSGVALALSAVSLLLQFVRQKWLSVELIKVNYIEDNKIKWTLRLINRKNRKHSISRAVILIDKKESAVAVGEDLKSPFINNYFQEGETKEICLYSQFDTENNFCLKFFTDGRVTKIAPRKVRKYLKENHLSLK